MKCEKGKVEREKQQGETLLHSPQRRSSDTADDDDAHLIEKVEGQGNHEKGHGIGRRDDGRQDKDKQEGMTAIAAEHTGTDNVHASQKVGHNGQLEGQAGHEGQGDEGLHVGIDGDHGVHLVGDAVGGQEAARDGKQHEIGEQEAQQEEDVGHKGEPTAIMVLAVTEGWGNEAEDLHGDKGRGEEQTEPEGGGDVGHELGGELGGNKGE